MAYVGTPIDVGNQFSSLVGKRFSGDASTTAFTLDVRANSALDIEVFVENVRQDPNSAYTVDGTTLTFTAAPPSGTNNVYVVHQAPTVASVSPTAGSVTASSFDNSVISGHTALAAIPATTDELLISDAGTVKRIDFSLLGNAPAFKATSASSQAITENSNNLVVLGTEVFDTDSAFASNKFTVPTGKAGLYKFDVIVRLDSAANDNLHSSIAYLYKDGTAQSIVYNNYVSHYTRAITMNISQILDLSADEYIEVYVACNTVNGGDATVTHNKYSIFSGHKLIT